MTACSFFGPSAEVLASTSGYTIPSYTEPWWPVLASLSTCLLGPSAVVLAPTAAVLASTRPRLTRG